MTPTDILQLVIYFGLLIIATPILGTYMANVYLGKKNILTPVFRPIESGIYRLAGITPKRHFECHYFQCVDYCGTYYVGIARDCL